MSGLGRSKIYDLMKTDASPKQVKIGNKSLWADDEVKQWVGQRKAERR